MTAAVRPPWGTDTTYICRTSPGWGAVREPPLEVSDRVEGGDHRRRAAIGLQPEVRARQLAIELLRELRHLRAQTRLHAVPLVGADLAEPPPLQGGQQREQAEEQHGDAEHRKPDAAHTTRV